MIQSIKNAIKEQPTEFALGVFALVAIFALFYIASLITSII